MVALPDELLRDRIASAPPACFMFNGRLYVDGGPSRRGWHFHETMLKCPQLHSYLYNLNIVFPTTVPLARGILLHCGLAHYYMRLKAVQQGEDPDAYHTPVDSLRICAYLEDEKLGRTRDDGQPERRGVKLADELAIVEEALLGYMARYANQDIEVLAVESELLALIPPKMLAEAEMLRNPECPVGVRVGEHALGASHEGWHCTCPGAYLYSQRPDLLARFEGWPMTVDHKSRGRKDERQTQGYCMSGQFHGYGIFGEQLWGKSFGGRMINYITWGSDTKDGRKQPQFERVVPAKRPWAQKSFPDTIRHSERLIQMFKADQLDPWRYPKTFIENGGCQHRYGACPGVALCSYGPEALAEL
jgi:hypothetical protein